MFKKHLSILFLLVAYFITFAHNIIPHHHHEHDGHTHNVESHIHSEHHTTEHHHHENDTDDENEETTLIHLFSFLFHSEGGLVFLNAHNTSVTPHQEITHNSLVTLAEPHTLQFNLPFIRLRPNNNSPCFINYLEIGLSGLRAPPFLLF